MAPLSILIVEDEAVVALEATLLLEEVGHRVVGTAATAAAAAELAAAEPVELAFADLNLDDGPSGTQVAEALARRGVAVVFTTANPDQIPPGFCGALGVVPKPYTAETLVQTARFVGAVRRGLEAQGRPRGFITALPAADDWRPVRLRLGSDTVAKIEEKDAGTAALLGEWRAVSVSTDFAA